MTEQEKQFLENALSDLEDLIGKFVDKRLLAIALCTKYPQILKKPVTLFLKKEDKFNSYLSLDEEFEYAFDDKEVEKFKSEHYVEVIS